MKHVLDVLEQHYGLQYKVKRLHVPVCRYACDVHQTEKMRNYCGVWMSLKRMESNDGALERAAAAAGPPCSLQGCVGPEIIGCYTCIVAVTRPCN